jgi:hypothetical protein
VQRISAGNENNPMILRTYTLRLEPANPLQFSLEELRSFFNRELQEYSLARKETADGFIHRYPAVQCKQVKGVLMVIGISQGADFLLQLTGGKTDIAAGAGSVRIVERDGVMQEELFGITDEIHQYEILTPWLALNQQNAKKFYDLKGKPARDAFMQKILAGHLATLAKSLDYPPPLPVTCTAHVRFIRERIERENMIVFLGKFTTNLRIPDYFGIGQSVSQGFGALRELPAVPSHEVPTNSL